MNPTPETKPRQWPRPWQFALVGALVGYPLSPAPVLWMLDRMGLATIASHAELYYWPLVFACQHIPVIQSFYEWQFRLLGVNP